MSKEKRLEIPKELTHEPNLTHPENLLNKPIYGYLHDRQGNTNRHDISIIMAQETLKNTVYAKKKTGHITFKDVHSMRLMLDHIKQKSISKRLYFALRDAILNNRDRNNRRKTK